MSKKRRGVGRMFGGTWCLVGIGGGQQSEQQGFQLPGETQAIGEWPGAHPIAQRGAQAGQP